MDLHADLGVYLDRKVGLVIDPFNQESIDRSLTVAKLPLMLAPGHRCLMSTVEKVEVPLGCVGFVQLRSTFARLGLSIPPTYADSGFEGTLTMEVFNTNQNPVLLRYGAKMWSVVVTPAINEPDYNLHGRYQHQGKGVYAAIALTRDKDIHPDYR